MTIEELLNKYVPIREPEGCWLWTGYVTPSGYGRCSWRDKMWMAHRLIYEHLVEPIPKGLQLDHLCRVRNCTNPAHLEPVTNLENIRRGSRATQTHCIHGHEYTAENTYVYKNARHCRICMEVRSRRSFNWQGGPWNRDKTHCPKGHAYDEANTRIVKNGTSRLCIECRRQTLQRYYQAGAPPRHEQTHCKRGHPFDEANTSIMKNGRRCKECHRQRARAFKAKSHKNS